MSVRSRIPIKLAAFCHVCSNGTMVRLICFGELALFIATSTGEYSGTILMRAVKT